MTNTKYEIDCGFGTTELFRNIVPAYAAFICTEEIKEILHIACILVVCSFLFSLSPVRKKTAPVSMPGACSSKQSLDPQPGSLPYSAFIEACDSGKQNFSLKRCMTQFGKNILRILLFI